MEALVKKIRFGANLQLPTVRLAARSIEDLAPGVVLRLPVAGGELAEWRVGGQRLARALAIQRGMQRAAQIETLQGNGGDESL
jgi:hypothetical protein